MEDGLTAAHLRSVAGVDLQDVAHLAQRVEGVGSYARLDDDAAAELLAIREARLFHRGLHVHVVIDDIRDELRVRERLIESTHDAEADLLIAALHEGGNDRVEGALASGERVW